MNTAVADPAALESERAQIQVTTVAPVVSQAQQIDVTDSASATLATEFLSECARASKTIEARRKELKGPVVEAGKRIDALFKELAAPIEQATQTVKPKLLEWRKAEDTRIAAENAERERIEREAREAAEAERRRQEDEARRQREAAAREAAAAAEAAKKTDDAEVQRKADEAARAEAEARMREQIAAESKPVEQVVERVEQPTMIKSDAGAANFRKVWDFEVTDPSAVPREFLVVNESAIRQAVRDGRREITGVQIFEDVRVAMRA